MAFGVAVDGGCLKHGFLFNIMPIMSVPSEETAGYGRVSQCTSLMVLLFHQTDEMKKHYRDEALQGTRILKRKKTKFTG